MNTSDNVRILKDSTANPAPLGLFGFGMTTVLLNFHNAGFYEFNSIILGMGIFFGGFAQIIAGIEEWKKNNTFGATAFSAYGSFWLTLVALVIIPKTSFGAGFKPDEKAMGCYLFMWGLFTLVMFIGTLKLNRSLQTIFLTLVVLFFLLATSDFTGSTSLRIIAGYEGILCGLSAFYAGAANVLNEVYGRVVLPV